MAKFHAALFKLLERAKDLVSNLNQPDGYKIGIHRLTQSASENLAPSTPAQADLLAR